LSVERNLIISILKLTREKLALIEHVNIDARVPSLTSRNFMAKMQNEGFIYLREGTVQVDSASRLKLAIKAISLGADVELVGNLLRWQEFEEIAAFTLKNYGYTVKNNVRFTYSGHRNEIDVVGCNKPLVVCIDCKHWQHAISASMLRKIVDAQTERAQALADSLPNPKLDLECTRWRDAKFLPAVLSLMPSSIKFCDKVPIVPILQLQDFLNQLPVHIESLKYYQKTFNSLRHNLQN
jgi:hypothetical protein